MNDKEKIDKVVEMIFDNGMIDGSYHKQWLLDQILRILLGDGYETWIEEYESEVDKNGDQMYEWDKGIAP